MLTSLYLRGICELRSPYSFRRHVSLLNSNAANYEGMLDKHIDKGQPVRVAKATPWISNMVTCEHPATDSEPAKVRIYQTHFRQKAIRFQPLKKTSTGFTKKNPSPNSALEKLFKQSSWLKSLPCSQSCTLVGDVIDGHVFHLGLAQPQTSLRDVFKTSWKGALNIADDTIVIGRGDYLEQATLDHDNTVLKLHTTWSLTHTRSVSSLRVLLSWATYSLLMVVNPVQWSWRLHLICCSQATKLLHTALKAPQSTYLSFSRISVSWFTLSEVWFIFRV